MPQASEPEACEAALFARTTPNDLNIDEEVADAAAFVQASVGGKVAPKAGSPPTTSASFVAPVVSPS